MRDRLTAWLACSLPERRLLGEAWFLLLLVGVALRILPLPRVQALLRRVVPPHPQQSVFAIGADRLSWLVGAAARRHLWSVSCLEKSLALQALLRRCHSRPELKIGVRREGDVLRAHAWVEVDGRPVGEMPGIDHRFLPFPEALAE